jgi:ElaB/YqjD/DUF883 family membrane-anchored ribosome-binding protein
MGHFQADSFGAVSARHGIMKLGYETPHAVKNDARTLLDDARGLLTATAEITDEKIAEARKRLEKTVEQSKECAAKGFRAADEAVRSRPYQSIAIAFGLGALVGLVLCRRSSATSSKD